MKKAVSIILIVGLVGAGAIVTGAMMGDRPATTSCADGYTSWEASEGMHADSGGPPLSLDRAIQQQLQEVIPVDVPESSVDRALVTSSGGTVEVRLMDADGQPAVLLLRRHQGGYIDGGATWCAPSAES